MTHAVAADRHLSVREFLLALAAASAVTAGAILSGAPVQLWSDATRLADRFFTSSAPSAPKREGTTPMPVSTAGIVDPDRNPFVAVAGKQGVRFHPFIGMVGTIWDTDQSYFSVRDYFGFRNSFSAYFDVPGAYRYVVITGNSEALGVTHREGTIAERLERILRERTKENFRVVNLAMNSATTAHEINYFVNLAFNLRPEFVISHSLATDIYYGSEAPEEFQYLGLFPYHFEIGWAKTLLSTSIDQRLFDRAFAPLKARFVAAGVVKNIKRYRAIAASSGAHFIWGVQKIEARSTVGSPAEAPYKLVDEIYRSFADRNFSEFAGVDMIDFNQIVGLTMFDRADPIHTDDVSAGRIAEAYADRILGRLSLAPKPGDRDVISRKADYPVGQSNNREEIFARAAIFSRIMQIAKLSGDDDRKLDDAASSVGFRRSTALLGNVDMFARVGDGQYHVRGWGLDSAHVEVDDPLMVVAISDGAVVMARETAGKHPPLARDYKIPASAGNNLQFEARLFCEPGKPVLFFVLTAAGTYARLTTHRCDR